MAYKHSWVCVTLLVSVLSLNNLKLDRWQANLTASINVTSCDQDYYGKMAVMGHDDTVSVWRRLDGNYFSNTQNISIGATVNDVKVNIVSDTIVVLTSNAVNIYYDFEGTFMQLQKLTLNASAISWSISFDFLLVGLGNGTILTYQYNNESNHFKISSTLETNHTSIGKMDSQASTVVVCGTGNDSTLTVYYYDTYKQEFVLSQVIRNVSGGQCSALILSPWLNRIVLGQSDGDIILFRSDGQGMYAMEVTNTKAHNGIVSSLAMTHHSTVLLSAGSDGNVSMWTESMNFTSTQQTLPLNATCLKWTPFQHEFLVASTNSSTVFKLAAINCESASNGTRCECDKGRSWLSDNCSVLVCSNDPYSTGGTAQSEQNACSCKQGYKWMSDMQKCMLDCSITPNSQGDLYNLHVCRCHQFTYWDNQRKYCRPDCKLLGVAIGKNQTQCECQDAYEWTTQSKCQVNCTDVAHSPSERLNSTHCVCNDGFKWNITLLTCEPIKNLNCSTVPNALPKNIDAVTCGCRSGYTWNNTKYACELDCQKVVNATGEDGKGGCTCIDGLVFLNKNKKCMMGLNCSGLRNSPGTSKDRYSCNCFDGYTYRERLVNDKKIGGCELECNRYSRTHRQNDPAYASCLCFEGYIWSTWPRGCIINCAGRADSTGKSISVLECECNSGFEWNFYRQRCERYLSTAAKLGLALGLVLGIVGLVGVGDLVWRVCKKSPPSIRPGAQNVNIQDGPPIGTDVRIAIDERQQNRLNRAAASEPAEMRV